MIWLGLGFLVVFDFLLSLSAMSPFWKVWVNHKRKGWFIFIDCLSAQSTWRYNQLSFSVFSRSGNQQVCDGLGLIYYHQRDTGPFSRSTIEARAQGVLFLSLVASIIRALDTGAPLRGQRLDYSFCTVDFLGDWAAGVSYSHEIAPAGLGQPLRASF
jgi:hypothetical protein